MESILSDADLKALSDVDLTRDDKRLSLTDQILDELVSSVDSKEPFLWQGQVGAELYLY